MFWTGTSFDKAQFEYMQEPEGFEERLEEEYEEEESGGSLLAFDREMTKFRKELEKHGE